LQDGAEQPLLDESRLAGMSTRMTHDMLVQMLARGLGGAEESCARLREAVGDPVTLAKEAHRLRGTAGTFGLARISALAGAIERRLNRGEPTADLLPALEVVLEATRTAVQTFADTPPEVQPAPTAPPSAG
jgi:HPt (histidine-containing phosphotransfer) domain-containing protein